MDTLKKAVVSTMAGVLVLGGYAAGRFVEPERAQAAFTETAAADAPVTTGGRTLPSFANLADQVSQAVVSIKVVAMQKAAAPNGLQEFSDEDNPFRGFRMPAPASGRLQATGLGQRLHRAQ